jgi:phage-related minor tail protein
MNDEIERLVIGVRADTGCFGRDVAVMRATLEDGLGSGAERAGRAVETALARAVRTGKLGFDDLKAVALHALGEIAAAALKNGIASVLGSGGGGLAGALTGLLGLPGRATGGPVSPGRAYLVGERGPEVFVPTSSGQVAVPGGGARNVRVAITINAGATAAPEAMARSGRQVARAVRAALLEAE